MSAERGEAEALPAPFKEDEESALRVRLERLWESPRTLYGSLSTVDHKKIGIRYLVTAFAFLALGGVEAFVIRLQLATPRAAILTPDAYDQFFSMHGITMIFWYAAPVLSGFGNYLIPLVLGARDMAFPRLNAFSYWTFLLSGVFLYVSVLVGQAPNAGWFAYVPLSSKTYSPGLNGDFYALALVFLTISTTVGAANFVVTILRLRAPGMAVHRMPLMTYSTGTTSVLILLSLPALTAACLFLELDRQWGTRFFDPARGGDPVLWQHAFWFFGHPWVYVIFLPATGMISMILPVMCRRTIVGYPFVAWSTVLTGVVGMGVWVHHMFAVGMNAFAMTFFSAASMTISVFSTIQVFAWIATLWKGKPVMRTPLLFALGFIASFVVGGLSGVVTAVIPFDWQVHDTYFVVGHLHYVLIGANLFPVMAALYYWFPKMSGRMLDESLGRWSFWLMFVGFQVGFFPMHLSGLLGMRRRVWTYLPEDGLFGLNLITTIGAAVLAVGLFVSLANVLRSMKHGRPGGENPWNADTLEWSTKSPPASYAFAHVPTVASLHPLWDEHDETSDPRGERTLAHGRQTLTTSAIDARPVGIGQMPEDTIVPLVLALAVAAVFTGLLLRQVVPAAIALILSGACIAAWLRPRPEKKA